ncbi:MAG: glycosyltransferase family 2 protein [Anaerolineae bacterium]|nr:glycosyltransferase family 2 protein [Anaerolineae bacterium]MDW8170947.1 glycosyltransferase family 2 protein [Anaerolineae bacterium]
MFFLTLLSNLVFFPRLKSADLASTPFVSVLIPARNESAVIKTTIQSFLTQTYTNFELLVLDDQSTDGTGELALQAANGDSRLRLLRGRPLPDGWIGKSWACHQLAQQAQGDIIIFTDADTLWQPQALAALIAHHQATDADLLTVWPTQITHTWSERVVVPLMMMVIMSYLPILMTHHSPFAIFAAANGQCMAWRRNAYQRIGGHTQVAHNILDDVTLARVAKQRGLRLRMADGNRLIACRMYNDWRNVRNGFAKNILAGYGNSVLFLAFGAIFHWLVFLSPYALLLTPCAPLALLNLTLGFVLRTVSAWYTHQRIIDSFSLPFGVLLMTRIAWQAIRWHYSGGVIWKDRRISSQTGSSHA